ncbi:GntR family transcriptional regulator [Novosphingobium colocasiae]
MAGNRMILGNTSVKAPLSDHVYGFIKDQLLEGRYDPDTWIPIEEISKLLGVSRQPVMGGL